MQPRTLLLALAASTLALSIPVPPKGSPVPATPQPTHYDPYPNVYEPGPALEKDDKNKNGVEDLREARKGVELARRMSLRACKRTK